MLSSSKGERTGLALVKKLGNSTIGTEVKIDIGGLLEVVLGSCIFFHLVLFSLVFDEELG